MTADYFDLGLHQNRHLLISLRTFLTFPPCAVEAQPHQSGQKTSNIHLPPNSSAQHLMPASALLQNIKKVTTYGYEISFGVFALRLWWNLHTVWLTCRKWTVEWAAYVFCYRLCYLLSCGGRLIYDCHCVMRVNLMNAPWWRGLKCVSVQKNSRTMSR